MKKLSEYITEKLIINKDMKITKSFDDKDVIYDIIIAAYLSIKRNKCWVESATFQKKIKYIQYNDILSILNETFNYKFSKTDIKTKSGNIWKIVKKYLIQIQNMCNYHNANVIIDNEKIVINYKDVDEKYKDILNR